MDYLVESARTMPEERMFHGDLIPRQWMMAQMRAAISAGNSLDGIKKAFFYGKDKDGVFARMRAMETYRNDPTCAGLPSMIGDGSISGVDVIHAILGIFTESTELLEALHNYIEDGQPVDGVNIKEEVGDLFWYIAILCRLFGFTFDEAQFTNIDKLFKRYPDRFSESQAINRDLHGERAVLEGTTTAMPALASGGGLTAHSGSPGGTSGSPDYAGGLSGTSGGTIDTDAAREAGTKAFMDLAAGGGMTVEERRPEEPGDTGSTMAG